MIGVAGKDLLGSIKLFRQQPPHQQVRPGNRAQGPHQVGPLPDGIVEPVRTADRERHIRGARIAPISDQSGESVARELFPALIQCDDDPAVRACREQPLALSRLEPAGWQAPPLLDLPDDQRPPQKPGIVFIQIPLRAGFQPPHRGDDDSHGSAPLPRPLRRPRPSTDRVRARPPPTSSRDCRRPALRGGTDG